MNVENLQLDDLAIKLDDFDSDRYESLYRNCVADDKLSKRIQDKAHFPCFSLDLDDEWFPFVPTSFKEIYISYLSNKDNFDEMAAKLVNLQQISIEKTTPKGIAALVKGSSKLETITIWSVAGNSVKICHKHAKPRFMSMKGHILRSRKLKLTCITVWWQ